MEMYTGKSIFKGIAIGKILFYQKGEQPVKRVKIEDTAEQIKRYEDARAKAAEQLQGLYEKALKEVGEANAAVFEVHQMMLEDDDYIDSVVNIIETQQVNAEFAVATTGDNFGYECKKFLFVHLDSLTRCKVFCHNDHWFITDSSAAFVAT